jgi:adenylate cyclase
VSTTDVALPALDRVLAAGRARYTGPEAASLLGVDAAWAARIWRAAGFEGAFEDRDFSDDDALVLAAAHELVTSGRFDEPELLALARLFNLAVAPLAEAAAISIRDQRQLDAADVALEEVERSIATFETVVLHTWRRRLLRVLGNGLAERSDQGVAFADLAGFTRLVRRPGDEWLVALERLEIVAFEIVAAHGGRVVKTIGDEVMFVHPERDGIVATCRALAEAAAADERLPGLRIGAAWGELVASRGDRFGTPVNLASRLVRRGRPGDVLLCPTLADAAGAPRLLPRWLKGFGLVRPGRLVCRR